MEQREHILGRITVHQKIQVPVIFISNDFTTSEATNRDDHFL